MIGSALALIGAIFGSTVSISIRIITTRTKLHYMVIPMGFVIGNLLLCPVFLTFKVLLVPIESTNMVHTTKGEIGSSLHVYSTYDILLILVIAGLNCLQQLA